MKRIALAFLILIAVPLFAVETEKKATLVDDVIRMTAAGVDEEAIIEFVRKSDDRVDVTASDLIAMTDAKVSKDVIRAVIDEADERDGVRRRERTRVVYEPRYVPVHGYASRYYDPFYYDPFWYGSRFSVGFGYWGPYYRPFYGGPFFYGGHRGFRGHRRR